MEVLSNTGPPDTEVPLENRQSKIHELFNDQGYSDYVVVYLRLITSGHLQKEAAFYENFIEGERGIKDFCYQVVQLNY
jgi:ubiquitin thioesterase protein OTUB1